MVTDTGWSYYQRSSVWKLYLLRGLVLLALGLILSSPLFALVWVPLALLRRNLGWRQVGPRLIVLLASACFLAWIRLFVTAGPLSLATANPVTVTMLALTRGSRVCRGSGCSSPSAEPRRAAEPPRSIRVLSRWPAAG